MDPISTVVIAAATAESYAGLSAYSHQRIAEAYETFKDALKRQLGEKYEVLEALEQVEKAPEDRNRWLDLHKQVTETKAAQHAELFQEANDLLDLIQREGGSDIIGIIIRAADRFANEGDVS